MVFTRMSLVDSSSPLQRSSDVGQQAPNTSQPRRSARASKRARAKVASDVSLDSDSGSAYSDFSDASASLSPANHSSNANTASSLTAPRRALPSSRRPKGSIYRSTPSKVSSSSSSAPLAVRPAGASSEFTPINLMGKTIEPQNISAGGSIAPASLPRFSSSSTLNIRPNLMAPSPASSRPYVSPFPDQVPFPFNLSLTPVEYGKQITHKVVPTYVRQSPQPRYKNNHEVAKAIQLNPYSVWIYLRALAYSLLGSPHEDLFDAQSCLIWQYPWQGFEGENLTALIELVRDAEEKTMSFLGPESLEQVWSS